ncbi:Asp-tRNA(Asn)/Glu-tRNA(Gln) amidotransferase subunit GatC [Sulfurospirillum sp. 1612]|uniref:Asp-tRNA(Asn)/Glu-tRNA(Gln) amidotransferase subunit GatC n=1 Tax=Sulfurospirillum sp. 1612 TaxID=3094835 RepID=UPI002F92693B
MQIDDKLLTKLEGLSALSIDTNKREEVISELSKIVQFVEILNELNLDQETATFTTLDGGTPFREDTPSVNPEIIETILEHAPKSQDGCFVVPKIIE